MLQSAWVLIIFCPCRIVNSDTEVEFQPSPFFSEQLTAFELWLQHGSKDKKPPEQLPIVLQVRINMQAAHSTDQQHEMAGLNCLPALTAACVLHYDPSAIREMHWSAPL